MTVDGDDIGCSFTESYLKDDLQLDQNNQLIRNTLTVVFLNAPAD